MPISFINITKWPLEPVLELANMCWCPGHSARNSLSWILNGPQQSDNTAPRRNGILLAPKQGKKNLAKFLGIDMSALSDYDGVAGVAGSTTQGM